jgi:penicillin-binding protein 2
VSESVSKSTVCFPNTAWWRGVVALLSLIFLAGFLPAVARQSGSKRGSSHSTAAKRAATAKTKGKTKTVARKPARTSRRTVHSARRRVARRHTAVRRRTTTTRKRAVRRHAVSRRRVAARRRPVHHRATRRVLHRRRRARRVRYRWRPNPTAGDFTKFDDPMVRQAAIAALGPYYGSVVAVNPNNGRILAVVNQKLAFSSGFEPCSTIKPVIALAALRQGLINGNTMIRVGRRASINLTEAIAHSNNAFFAELGRRLGFATVSRYAHLLGLGQRAGWDMPEEHPGTFPSAPPPAWRGGIGKMTSFGEGIRITPLQLAAEMSAFANGGSLYYLQYPRTEEQVKDFTPRLKRRIDLAPYAADIREGMLGAVEFGTARESYTPDGELVYAKTGTCTDETRGGHLGWFVSYAAADAEHNRPKLVLVVLLRRYGPRVSGPHAAKVGGRIYRRLYMKNFFSADNEGWRESSSDNR